MFNEKKKKEDSNEASQFLHSKTWPILINSMTHFEGLIGEIEAMLTTIRKWKNYNKLKPIADTVIFLQRLRLPFKKHRDDSQHHLNDGEYSRGDVGNHGNCE